MSANYRWKIEKDHTEEPGTPESAKGVCGPCGLNPDLASNPAHFSLYDDDGECYYEGTIYGDYDGFEPLEDFGMSFAGCTGVKINGEWL